MLPTAGLLGPICFMHLENCKWNKKKKNPVLLTSVCALQMDCFATPFFLSPSPPTQCSVMSAGDLIGQIDCECNFGVWVNQSDIVKQFFGPGGGLVLPALSSSEPILPGAGRAFRAKGHGLTGSMENHTRTTQHAPLPLNAPPLYSPFCYTVQLE